MFWSGIWLEPGGFYLATGLPDCYPGGEQAFTVTDNGSSGLVVWGFSVYRRKPGYRTLGIGLRAWLDRHPDMVVTVDRDRTKDPRPKRAPKVEPTPWRSVEEDPPASGQKVLVAWSAAPDAVAARRHDYGAGIVMWTAGDEVLPVPPTVWMPIPPVEAPRG
jgi:hypothetical protein